MPRLAHPRRSLLARDYLTQRALYRALATAVARARSALTEEGSASLVIDLGCGHKPYAGLLQGMRHVGVNLDADDASPDIIADAARLPLPDGVADLVLCTQVLEHVPQPRAVVDEAARVLRPDGAIVVSVPFWWPLHEEPHDYWRFTSHGLSLLLGEAGFDRVEVQADCCSLTQAAVAFVEALPRAARGLIPLINVLAPTLEGRSRDSRSPINWVAVARRR